MSDVMIDIETLDTRASAVILSIGAVKFDPNKQGVILEGFHEHIDIDSCLKAGRTVSGSTVLWWLEQENDARNRIVDANRISLHDALAKLSTFIGPNDRVWGNGAAFDNAVLTAAYDAVGLPAPWKFWNDRCYRTMKSLYSNVPQPAFAGVAHDALDDAVKQALHLQDIFAEIAKGAD